MNEIQTIPLTAHESECTRLHKTIKWLIIGWAVSVLLLVSLCYSFAFSEYETTTTTETTTEETYTDESVAQDSGDSGSNIYAGGDYYGNADN